MKQQASAQEASAGQASTRRGASPAFVFLSFEGPDAYSRADGLGARVERLGPTPGSGNKRRQQ